MGWYGDNPDEGDPDEISEGEYLSQNGDNVIFRDEGRRSRAARRGAREGRKKFKGKPAKSTAAEPQRPDPRGAHYYPETDEEAIAIIESLHEYRWDSHHVTGQFSHDPYWITASIGGALYTIHLKGRRGTVLTWLRDRT
jgi:hypothetical protein